MILLNLLLTLSAFVSIVVALSLAAWLNDHLAKLFKPKEASKAKSLSHSDWQPLPPSPANQAKVTDEKVITFRPVLHSATPSESYRKAA